MHIEMPQNPALRSVGLPYVLGLKGRRQCSKNWPASCLKKLDGDFRSYMILGACNPGVACNALGVEPQIGLLPPNQCSDVPL